MSSTIQAPSRSLLRALKSTNQRPSCQCIRTKRFLQAGQGRLQSSTATTQVESSVRPPPRARQGPRWAETPPAMKAPVRTRPKKPDWKPFVCNNDPARLDSVYTRFLGKTGPKMLADETKWLAVTHKSYDHGRRGFNDRMSFLGRQIVELQTSLEMLDVADVASPYSGTTELDAYGRLPFDHPATANVEVLTSGAKQTYMHVKRMSKVAVHYGLDDVVRWQPKDVDNLSASGCDLVYVQALYAIIGALSLEQGALVANRVVRERILQAIGLGQGSIEEAPRQEQLR